MLSENVAAEDLGRLLGEVLPMLIVVRAAEARPPGAAAEALRPLLPGCAGR